MINSDRVTFGSCLSYTHFGQYTFFLTRVRNFYFFFFFCAAFGQSYMRSTKPNEVLYNAEVNLSSLCAPCPHIITLASVVTTSRSSTSSEYTDGLTGKRRTLLDSYWSADRFSSAA